MINQLNGIKCEMNKSDNSKECLHYFPKLKMFESQKSDKDSERKEFMEVM